MMSSILHSRMLDDEQEKIPSALAEYYKQVDGWNEKDVLQFAVTALNPTDADIKLQFLENQVKHFEKRITVTNSVA